MTAAFGLLLVIISGLLWNYARGAADQTYDLLLAGAALSVLETVSANDDKIAVDLPHSALDILSLAPEDRVFYAVTTESEHLTGWKIPPAFQRAPSAAPAFFNQRWSGVDVRVATQSRRIATPEGRRWVTAHVAHTTIARDRHASSLFMLGLGGLGLVSVLGLAFVWLSIKAALYPLARVERELESRDPTDLTQLKLQPPREIAGLVCAINGFMGRLEHTRRQSEGFIADVAHQTRTGLAALQGHLSLANDALDITTMKTRLERAGEQATRTIRLTNQLLSHAMVIHRAENRAMTDVNVLDLTRILLSDLLRDTALRSIDVEFEDAGADHLRAYILGDEISLREALRNIIENAVQHGPEDNCIAARVRTCDEQVIVEVEDRGPGLSCDLRQEAVQRFSRFSSKGGGSGLGLAIVKEVCDAHSGHLELLSGREGGLLVRLSLPAKPRLGLPSPREPRRNTPNTVSLLTLALAFALVVVADARAASGRLQVWSATDTEFILPLIDQFEALHDNIMVEYREFDTSDLHEAIIKLTGPSPDLVISSAADLQVDLVNRGMALPVQLNDGAWHRPWSMWRSELFGFTFEPSAVVYHRPSLTLEELPGTHADMAVFLRENEERLYGRIGTYDIRHSGAGYLLATQDARLNPQFFRIAETLGRAGVKIYCCTTEVTSKVANGELLLGLNVIGSYALAAARENADLGVHFYDDFNPVMLRTAFVPKTAGNPAGATKFINFLLSEVGQRALAERSGLLPLDPEFLEMSSARDLPSISQDSGRFVPIRLSVGLLTYLDGMKRAAFLENWETAVQAGGTR